MEEIYYEKILVSSGEVPEAGEYLTDQGDLIYTPKTDEWVTLKHDYSMDVEWYMKPVPSPKQEVGQLIEDYKRRIKTIGNMKGKDTTEIARLVTKSSCYKTFITELERVIR